MNNETQKNHQNAYEGPQTRPRMYEMPEDDLCPIKSIKLYLSKLDPASDLFYNYPITSKNWKPADKIWYTSKQIGKNSIGDFMKKISKRLQLSKLYTNHEIRHTTVTVLSNAGFPTRDIMNLTKHKNEKSIKSGIREDCRLCTLHPVASLPHPVAGATPWGQAYLTGLGGQGGEWSASGQVVWGDRAESGQPVVRWSGGLVVWWSGGAEQSGCCLSQITSPCVN